MKQTRLIPEACLFVLLLALVWSCNEKDSGRAGLEEIAANEEVLDFMKTFDGRGALSDTTQPSLPANALKAFRYPDDISIDLVLAEPDVTQPVFMNFDHRGRLWVVQYNQYPYPRGLKVTAMDQHIRATFDKIPPPPGEGVKGADKITFFEDEDGDGRFEKSTDAITGLNIATSVALGRGQIWVLNPPYLLAYPDADDDGIPDSRPVVHLNGFGIEDTHAVANNLRWGPDGWLYGAQGSTCTANISSAASKNVRFEGQAIWRYHPETKVFEVFAEGGGNTFDVEIDGKGRLYSGDNGTSRGQYYKPGAYYVRNFGKHGALSNPYAFGYLPNMELEGAKVRFTHAFVRYEGASLPDRYENKMIAINSLQGYVQLSSFESNGSTFRIVDEERILETEDNWFRPVDIAAGPDGSVYIADWYDSRLSHVDPRDTWSKTNGRIYRIKSRDANTSLATFDLSKLAGSELIGLLSHDNRWHRQEALRVIGDRRDKTLVGPLKKLFETGTDQVALEALWAINLCGGLTDEILVAAMGHADPFVRLWAVRLSGERQEASPAVVSTLADLASGETHAEVRSQLAATARRLQGDGGVAVIGRLLKNHDDSSDPDIPLQIWWALESKVAAQNKAVLDLFNDEAIWRAQTVRGQLLERLMQRYALGADSSGFASCARLIELAPTVAEVKILMNGMQEGLRGRDGIELPVVLVNAIKPYRNQLGEHSLSISLRQGDKDALKKALLTVQDRGSSLAERLAYIRIFGEIQAPECVPVLLELVENNHSSPALRQSALQALQRYDAEEIGKRIAKAYPDKLRADPGVRSAALSLFAARPAWAEELLNAIDRRKLPGETFIPHTISRDDVPQAIVQQLKQLNNERITAMATRIWPEVKFATASQKTKRIGEVTKILEAGGGNIAAGKQIYLNSCGACHKLFDEGGTLGPDLTGYDRKNTAEILTNIIDPQAYIREGYVTYRFTTADGRILSGNVKKREGTSVHINLISGESIILREPEIKDMQAQPSIMPDNLLDNLTDQQLLDLFAYLKK